MAKEAGPVLDQLEFTLNEIAGGAQDFTPTPEESRAIAEQGYHCRATLFLRFREDGIDESRLLASRLQYAYRHLPSESLPRIKTQKGLDKIKNSSCGSRSRQGGEGGRHRGGKGGSWQSLDADIRRANVECRRPVFLGHPGAERTLHPCFLAAR